MKLYGFVNWTYGIRGYYISNASTAFKKRFPKKYIVVSIDRNEVFNADSFESIPISLSKSKMFYFFTMDSSFYNGRDTSHGLRMSVSKEGLSRMEALKVMPADLSCYLMNPDTLKDNDMVIKLEPIDAREDPRLMTSIVFRCSSKMLMQSKVKETLNKLIEMGYHDFKPAKTTEEWLLMLIDEIPFGINKSAIRFPDIIEDKLFKKPFKASIDDFFVTYSARGQSIIEENKLVEYLEKELSSYVGEITLVNDYTDIVSRVEEACKKKKLKYKREGISIVLKIKDFYSLDLDFELINFFQY